MKLGIDIGNVITAGGNEIFTPQFLQAAQMSDAFESIKTLTTELGSENVYLVSKAGEIMQSKTRQWFLHHNFYEITGVLQENLHFCKKRYEKTDICEQFGITSFIDDRLEILGYLSKLDQINALYLFHPDEKEIQKHAKYLKGVVRVESWKELMNKIKIS